MARLDDMRVFAQLATAGTFSGTARDLGLTKQTVSRRIQELEEALGVELVRRTTRRVTLTDVGRAYADRCAEVVRLADEANRAAASRLDEVAGTLRVTADHTAGELLLPRLIAAFARRHPGVRVELTLTTRKVDLLAEGYDVAFRIGPPPNVLHLASRRLAAASLWTVGSPDYLRRRGAPASIPDLAEHDLLSALPDPSADSWPLRVDGELRMVPIRSRIRANDVATVRAAAVAGLGLAHLPSIAVVEDLATGRLARVLEAASPDVGGIHVVYPHSRLLEPKVTEFVALALQQGGG